MFVKYVSEAALQCIKRFPGCKAGDNLFVDKMKPAQVIYAVDMVRVGVAEKHGIDAPDMLP